MRRFQVVGYSIVLASFARVDAALPPQRPGLSVSVSSTSPFALTVSNQEQQIENTAILAGNDNNTATPVSATKNGVLKNGHGHISIDIFNSQVAKVTLETDYKFVGARFSGNDKCDFYGVWEYPWNDHLTNNGIKFDLKGLGDSQGVNWDNARAPFFLSSDGYGVYADIIDMGSYDFTQPGSAEFIFNTSSLDYYIILPKTHGDMKSILAAYAELSSTIYMPPDSSYGPTFWSDDWEQDFHRGVHNAQQNYYDTVDHLYKYQIHATAMFADRPYGTVDS
jgi:alpha-D-xyloside xylohydrolase